MLSTECPSDRMIYVASDPEVEKVTALPLSAMGVRRYAHSDRLLQRQQP